jgi:carbon-monoxide dehydrogenase small subunit
VTVTLTVNGQEHAIDAGPMTPLATVLRERLGLTGTKLGCGEGFCGSCLVLVDGEPLASCLLPIGLVGDRRVTTIEGLADDALSLTPLQQALKDHDAVQCGMCFPGMIMTLTDLLRRRPQPDAPSIRDELTGNICRCTGYERIIEAVLSLRAGESAPRAAEPTLP